MLREHFRPARTPADQTRGRRCLGPASPRIPGAGDSGHSSVEWLAERNLGLSWRVEYARQAESVCDADLARGRLEADQGSLRCRDLDRSLAAARGRPAPEDHY